GKPGVGGWYDFSRIPGRARSHTRPRKWETFRLHGTLAGHRRAYTESDGRFFQPRSMRAVATPSASWWSHEGPLVMVLTGISGGDLAVPVRLPASPCNQAVLDHHLSNPALWHKVDLVRQRDPMAAAGWRYEAHLMVLTTPYVSQETARRRAVAATQSAGRKAGIDVNVSNVTVASHKNGEDLRITRVTRDAGGREGAEQRAAKKRRHERALERSRRAANPERYDLSRRQQDEAQRRADEGLPPRAAIPKGGRKSRADGKPLVAYRTDHLSRSYRRKRAAFATEAAAAARAKRDHARRIAGSIVLQHGFQLAVEENGLSAWARRWGRTLHAFAPGMLIAAIEREAVATASQARLHGGLVRASTHATALSQHCLCGRRVEKTLAERAHYCPCGLSGDRDAVSATLAAHLVFGDVADPGTAVVDYATAAASLDHAATRELLRSTLDPVAPGRQDALSESTAPNALDGKSAGETWRTPAATRLVARRIVGMAPRPTPDETVASGRTTPDRVRMRTDLPPAGSISLPSLRDSS
ncbi:MAG TPA: hypothetical protein VFK85_12070, partial [Anaeromyxobacteraceae bacterium]|nr:hypothetical protein [Anaeromyxobacteraceae bacterium]